MQIALIANIHVQCKCRLGLEWDKASVMLHLINPRTTNKSSNLWLEL